MKAITFATGLIQPKHFQMKKITAIFLVAGLLIACNDSGKTDDSKKDTASKKSVSAAAVADAAPKMTADSTMKPDSANHKSDTSVKK